ncbi:MAG TPA: N-acetylneuraminate synthase family protein, partial [Cytophagales bacterium]|nr:N-acetylneuraminate synthase family protein [Cytophagales bacterium]
MGVKIIAETAFSHEGDFDYLLRQIDAAHKAQADIVKFQIFLSPATYYVPEHPALETIGKFVFSVAQWKQALEHAAALGIEVLALPLEKEALEFCMNHAALVHYIELHSVCLNEVQMLEALKRWEGKVVLGVGGYTLEEI